MCSLHFERVAASLKRRNHSLETRQNEGKLRRTNYLRNLRQFIVGCKRRYLKTSRRHLNEARRVRITDIFFQNGEKNLNICILFEILIYNF
jgi:hypothetical protein